jgi:hypothetical protein
MMLDRCNQLLLQFSTQVFEILQNVCTCIEDMHLTLSWMLSRYYFHFFQILTHSHILITF